MTNKKHLAASKSIVHRNEKETHCLMEVKVGKFNFYFIYLLPSSVATVTTETCKDIVSNEV